MPTKMLSELYGFGLARNDSLLNANGNAQRALSSVVTDWPQMTASLMPLEMLSELCGYGLAATDDLLDANRSAQLTLWLRTGPR